MFVTPAKCDLCAHYGPLTDNGDWFVCKDTTNCHLRDAKNKARHQLLEEEKQQKLLQQLLETFVVNPALTPLIWFSNPEMIWNRPDNKGVGE